MNTENEPTNTKGSFLSKILLIPVLLAIACVVAGVYGVLHNQISYTVGPEYFTKLKFYQFGIVGHFPDRVGASIVGWFASWWMGIVIGIFIVPLGLPIRTTAAYFRSVVLAFGVVALTALVVGLFGLALGYATVDPARAAEFSRYGVPVVDRAAFWRAGSMHNFSYLGGLAGILTGGIWLVRRWPRRGRDGEAFDNASDER